MNKAISVSTGPIFTIFSPNGRYLRDFSWSSPVFPIPQGTLPWQPFCVIPDLFAQSRSISGSAEPIFIIFAPYGRCWIADDQSDLLFSDILRDVAISTNYGQKWQNDRHSANCHSKTNRVWQFWFKNIQRQYCSFSVYKFEYDQVQ